MINGLSAARHSNTARSGESCNTRPVNAAGPSLTPHLRAVHHTSGPVQARRARDRERGLAAVDAAVLVGHLAVVGALVLQGHLTR